jgi:hypothetical protein
VLAETTFACKSVLGVEAGNGCRTTADAFGKSGVAAPQAGVNSTVSFPFGLWLRPASGRRWPVPFHVPTNEKRVTRSVPFASIPIDERPGVGPC